MNNLTDTKESLPANICEYTVPGTNATIMVETEANHPDRQTLLQGNSLCIWVHNAGGKLVPLVAFNRQAYYVYMRHSTFVYELLVAGGLAVNFEAHWKNISELIKYRMENAAFKAAQ